MQKRTNFRNVDLNGRRFGRLQVVEKVENSRSAWVCMCDCGNVVKITASRLLDRTISCGCALKDARNNFATQKTTHGDSYTKLYKIYRGMIDRCFNPNIGNYKRYGAIGISVCDEWKDSYLAFKEWSYKNGYNEDADRKHQSLDRIDVKGDYSPENCRWATAEQQANNRAVTKFYEYNGIQITASKFADMHSIPKHYVYGRIKRGRTLYDVLYEWNCQNQLPENLIECDKVAKQMGITAASVKRKINKGELNGKKIGRKWYVIK